MQEGVSKSHDQLTPADLALSPCWYDPDCDGRALTRSISPASPEAVSNRSWQQDSGSLWAVDLWPAELQLSPLAGVVRGNRGYCDPWSAGPCIVLPQPIGRYADDPLFDRFSLAVESKASSVVRLSLPRLTREQPRFGPSRYDEAAAQASAVLRAMGVTPAAFFPLRCALRVPLRSWPAEFTIPGFMSGSHSQERLDKPVEYEVLDILGR
jgi:hypothetical protein